MIYNIGLILYTNLSRKVILKFMRRKQLFSRILVVLIVVMVLLGGIVGIYRQFINPKYLKVKGIKVPTSDVMQAYYQMNPGVSHQVHVSRRNAIEAFLLKQRLYQDYLEKTQDQWFEGVVLDQKEGYTTSTLGDSAGEDNGEDASRAVRRYLIDSGSDILCVYTSNPEWRFSVGTRVKVKLGMEFTMLSGWYRVQRGGPVFTVRFASAIQDVVVMSAQPVFVAKPEPQPHSKSKVSKPRRRHR